jgi:hypothetical protein
MTASRFRTSGSRILVLLGLALLTSCDGPPSAPQPLHPGDVRAFVTVDLAAQLTGDGRFPLTGPAPEPYPQVSPARAAEIAVAWSRTFGRFHGSYLERQHRRAIDFGTLEVVSPVYYAVGVYEAVPDDAPAGARNAFGPHYLVYLGTGGEPVLSVSVAAFTGAWVADGQLHYPTQHGRDVVAQGVNPSTGFGIPPSPEQAVRIASMTSGAQVRAVPELVRPHRDYLPHHARWRVVLDRPIRARERRTGRTRLTGEIYVGLRGETSIPADAQPGPADEVYGATGTAFRLVRRPGRPVAFEPADLSGQ